MSTTIAIEYALYEKVGSNPPAWDRVTETVDVELEAALAAADTNKVVIQVPGVEEQTEELHEHVLGVPFELPTNGHTIGFGTAQPSRWDSDSHGWLTVVQGASLHYAVEPTSGATGRLRLAVWTVDALGEGDDEDAMQGDGIA
jgi:hypothetical protein